MGTKIKIGVLLILLFVPIAIFASTSTRSLRVGVASLPPNFDVASGGGAYHTAVLRPLHRNLVKQSVDGSIQADLAARWSLSADRKVYDFCLVDKKFQDGTLITFDDIEFSIQRLSDEAQSTMVSRIFQVIQPHAVRGSANSSRNEFCFSIHLSKPYINFVYLLASPFASIVKKDSSNECRGLCDVLKNRFSGPYHVMNARNEAGGIFYEKIDGTHASSWGAIELRPLANITSALQSIERNELDVYLGLLDFQEQVKIPKKVCVTYWNSMSFGNFKFNYKWAPIADATFRSHLAAFVQNSVRQSLKGSVNPLKYYPSLIPQAVIPKQASFQDDAESRLLEWKGKVPPGRFRIVSRLNMVNADAINKISSVLLQLGLKVEYLHGYDKEVVSAIKGSDFEIVFGTWVSSFGRADDLINILHVLLKQEVKDVPTLNKLAKKIENSIQIEDTHKRDRLLAGLVHELEQSFYINPVFKIHIPIYHRCDIKSPLATWQFHPRIDSLKQES